MPEIAIDDTCRYCVLTTDDARHDVMGLLVAPEPLLEEDWTHLLQEAEGRWEGLAQGAEKLDDAEWQAYNNGLIGIFLYRNPGFTSVNVAEYSY